MAHWIAALVIAGMVAVAVGAKLLLRRRSPLGGWFTNPDVAAGILGVLGTLFAVLLAFVIFVALSSYESAKRQAGVEAVAVTELYRVATLFPEEDRARLQGGLVCYARAVVADEWPAMRDNRSSPLVDRWIVDLGRGIAAVEPRGARQEIAYGQWFDEETLRSDGRRGRLAEAAPFVPAPLWIVLGLGAALVVAWLGAQADRREGVVPQALGIAFVTAVVTSGLLVVAFLDRPYEDQNGSIRPAEMVRTLDLIARESALRGRPVPAPCDGRGAPRPA